jgi:hypothetical protein
LNAPRTHELILPQTRVGGARVAATLARLALQRAKHAGGNQ